MWSKSGPLESRGGAALRERLSRLSFKSRQMLQICRGWPCPTVAALIRGPAAVWYSVGKHLFARRALLHLSGVTASACKQGGANCLSPSFLWFRGSANKQSGEFYTPGLRSVLRAPRATSVFFFFPLVPSAAVIRVRTNGKHADMKANVQNFTHACRSWCSRRNTWAAAARLPCHTSHHPCGSIKVALAAFGLVSEDCFSQ